MADAPQTTPSRCSWCGCDLVPGSLSHFRCGSHLHPVDRAPHQSWGCGQIIRLRMKIIEAEAARDGLRVVWDDEPLSPEDAAMIDNAWERHKASGPMEMADRFVGQVMRWHPDTPDDVRSMVIANVRGFAAWLVEQRHDRP